MDSIRPLWDMTKLGEETFRCANPRCRKGCSITDPYRGTWDGMRLCSEKCKNELRFSENHVHLRKDRPPDEEEIQFVVMNRHGDSDDDPDSESPESAEDDPGP